MGRWLSSTQKPSPSSHLRKNDLIPHESGSDRKIVNVTFDGKKVGTATITTDGTLSVLLNDQKVVELMSAKREIQHLSIAPTYKA